MRVSLMLLAGAGVWLAGCAGQPPAAPPAAEPAPEQIFARDGERAISRDELMTRMLAARVVYLGEKHDSARQHVIQRELIEEMVARGARPAVGLEIFYREQTGLLMGYVNWKPAPHMRNNAESAEAWLLERLRWSGDTAREQTWRFYGPLLEAAREHGLVSFGIDLPTALRGRISKVGTAGLSHVEQALLAPTGFDDPGYESLMRSKLKAAHCGFGSDAYLGRLYDNWVARNDAMARAVVAALDDATEGPVVVIVGAGHLQHGMGVVERVAALAPGIEQLNFAMREVPASPLDPAHHFEPLVHEGRRFAPDHEYLWFTAAPAEAVDYCEGFAGVKTEEEEE